MVGLTTGISIITMKYYDIANQHKVAYFSLFSVMKY